MFLDTRQSAQQPGSVRARRRSFAHRPQWERSYVKLLVGVDALAVLVASLLAQQLRFGSGEASLSVRQVVVPYLLVVVAMVPVWLSVLATGGCYQARVVGVGPEEYRRVINAAVRFLAVVAVVLFVGGIDLARGYVGALIPLALAMTLVGRYGASRWLHRLRAQGRAMHRVLVVGNGGSATGLARHFQRAPYAGFQVVGACVRDAEALHPGGVEIPVYGDPDDVVDALLACQADVLAFDGSSALGKGQLQSLAWQLEGTGIDLIVAPAVTDVAGPRVATRPVAGLPLLHVEEPTLEGPARVLKATFERTAAALALLLLSPVLVIIAVAVKATTPGPVLFRQERVGLNGRTFRLAKFRTMGERAEEELIHLADRNEHDGPLFKLREDPRRTRLGRWLRRWSLDELPQLWQVLLGHMALVGPRPPLPSEVERYEDHVHRRLLVKPGLTGLWQVSGRADLPWEEAVRLDLYYVDNWSISMDIAIIWKTLAAIVRGDGAY